MIGESRELEIERIPVGRIRPRGFDGRREATDTEIARLAASIRNHGLLHPILLRPRGRDFEVVCGQRRWRAIRSLGWGEIPAIVRPLDAKQAFELSLAENARREALTAIEQEDLLKRLLEYFPGRKRAELVAWLGPAGTLPGDDVLPGWIDAIPETEARPEGVSVVMASSETLSSPSPPPEPAPALGGDTKVIIAPSADAMLKRRPLLYRTRELLQRLNKSGHLDMPLLDNIVGELRQKFETRPPYEFLDLATHGRSKRYISRHCLNVAKLAMFLGGALKLPPPEIEQLAVCGLLHDVGMMKVKEEVFTKHAALDQEEWEQVKGHPIEGALLLTKEVVLRDVVARVALEHHEKPDGSGYPEGKKKDETHLYARIINVVDTYGAMVSPRAHRLPLIPYEAMRVVMDDGAKGMLDWDLVQQFVRAMSIYPLGSYVRLEGGEIGRVVRAQPEIPEKPVIAVVADAQRNMLRIPVEIDLAMTEPMPVITPIASPL
jgi:HD-GYP domain-containing protein (c-di-GMP phosphodiesterase class II)